MATLRFTLLAAALAALPHVVLAQTKPSPAPETGAAAPATDGGINFGDDSAEWANDGECDDRRFTGTGMAIFLSWSNTGRDASDCSALVSAGSVRLWNLAEAQAATQCDGINFGDDTGSYPSDSECDDARFEGFGMATNIGPDEVGRDATDCRRACDFGLIGLRDY
jgi:hypothetical protein